MWGSRRPGGAIAGVLVATGALVAGCGGDDDESGTEQASNEVASLEITTGESGGEATIEAPESAPAGLTEITLTNEGEQVHSAQLIRVEGEHDEAEVMEGLVAAQRGEAFPEWFYAGGGAGSVQPGESATVTQELLGDSTYWAVDDEARGEPPMVPIEITGEAGDAELTETSNKVTAVDYDFEAEGLAAGEPITFENAGEQPHHMIAVPFTDEEATIEDAEQFFETEEGRPPLDFDAGDFTSVLEGGTEQVSAATLESGRYALICFISDREGGPSHLELGMIEEVEVE